MKGVKCLAPKDLKSKLISVANLSFKINGNIKYFHDKELIKYMNTKLGLQNFPKDTLETEKKV